MEKLWRLYRVIAGTVFYLSVVHARSDTLPLQQGGQPDTGWDIEFDPVKVISPFFIGTPDNVGRAKDGNLEFDHVIFTDLNPIDVEFKQSRREVNAVNFGLRITLTLDIRNESQSAWSGFKLDLIDRQEFDSEEAMHPGFAHFHNLGPDGTLAFPPFRLLNIDPTDANPNFDPSDPTARVRGDVWLLGAGLFPI